MTARTQVLSLWRGVVSVRLTLSDLAAARGFKVADLRDRTRGVIRAARRREFIHAALAAGASQSEVARFLHRTPSTINKTVRPPRRTRKASS